MIDKEKWYNTPEVVALNLNPLLSSVFRVKRCIDRGILKGNRIGKGNGLRYFVKGEELIMFLAKWESGDFK